MDHSFLQSLRCPYCLPQLEEKLQFEKEKMQCPQCKNEFIIHENIPVLLRKSDDYLNFFGRESDGKKD